MKYISMGCAILSACIAGYYLGAAMVMGFAFNLIAAAINTIIFVSINERVDSNV